MSQSSSNEARFWSFADPLLATPFVTRSTMMGFPCLRVSGRFFASFDRQTGALVVKMSAARVDELISSGQAQPFAGGTEIPRMGQHRPEPASAVVGAPG